MPKYNADKGKTHRQNQIKRLLSLTTESSALSITEIADRLNNEGYTINRKPSDQTSQLIRKEPKRLNLIMFLVDMVRVLKPSLIIRSSVPSQWQ
jgi:hypothetical protein